MQETVIKDILSFPDIPKSTCRTGVLSSGVAGAFLFFIDIHPV